MYIRSWVRILGLLMVAVHAVACGQGGDVSDDGEATPTTSAGADTTNEAATAEAVELDLDAATAEFIEEEASLAGYDALPFTDILPLPEGPIEIDGDTPEIVIGFSQTCFNHPWRAEMLDSVVAEVERHPNVSVVVTDGDCDIATQSNDVDDLMARGVDAVVMSPVESDGLVPAADRVMEAGVPLVVLDRDVFSDKDLFIGQSNVTMAEGVANQMVEDLGGEGNILEITGLVGSSPAIDRSTGMENAIEGTDIEVLATGDGEWIREPSVALMEDWLISFDDIDAVFSHAEESSWGAQLAIGRAGACGMGIRHYTHDGSAAGFQSVAGGAFQADGNYSPYIGDIGVRAALMLLRGEEIPDRQEYDQPGYLLQLPDLPVVTGENAEEWIPDGWGTFEPPPDPCQ